MRTMNWMFDEGLGGKFRKTGIYTILCDRRQEWRGSYCVRMAWRKVDLQAEEDVMQYREFPFTNHQKCYDFPIWKARGRRIHVHPYRNPRRTFYIRSSETERMCRRRWKMASEALLNRF